MTEQELYHAWLKKGAKSQDHKYVKREWKNGRWQYYYDNGSKTTNKTSSGTNTTYDRGRINRAVDSGKSKIKNYLDGRKRDWNESEKRGTYKAIKEARKYDGGVVIKDGHIKKIAKTSFKDTDYLLSGKTTIESTTSRVSEVRRGKIERYVDTAKEYIKDRFGFDERDRLQKADDVVNKNKQRLDDARKVQDEAFRKYFLEDDPVKKAEAKKEYDKRLDEANKVSSEWQDSLEKRRNASFDYSDTALKKTEDAKRFIDDRIFDLEMTVDSIIKFPGAAAAVVGDKIEDFAWDVEYTTSRAIGIDQKKNYESAKKALKEYEENYKRSRGTSNEFLAEFYLNEAKEKYRKAEIAYSGTPLERIESGMDYVSSVLNGDKKKRKK